MCSLRPLYLACLASSVLIIDNHLASLASFNPIGDRCMGGGQHIQGFVFSVLVSFNIFK